VIASIFPQFYYFLEKQYLNLTYNQNPLFGKSSKRKDRLQDRRAYRLFPELKVFREHSAVYGLGAKKGKYKDCFRERIKEKVDPSPREKW
jgi:hypothetical protein